MDRLVETAQILKDPQVFHSNAGRQQLHFFYQQFADPSLGSQDLLMSRIIDRLDAGTKSTVAACFDERKKHGLGYIPERKRRADATEPWLVEVTCLCCICIRAFYHIMPDPKSRDTTQKFPRFSDFRYRTIPHDTTRYHTITDSKPVSPYDS